MRSIVFASILFATPLAALDSESVDGDTLRYTRHVLLQDEVRNHFKLRIGAYEPLDQAVLLDARLNGAERKVVVLRKGSQLACVVMKTGEKDKLADYWLFLQVEDEIEVSAECGGLMLDSKVADEKSPNVKKRARFLQLKDDGLATVLTFVSEDEVSYQDGRYRVRTTRRLSDKDGLKLLETTEYLLDDEAIPEGDAERNYKLVERDDALQPEEITVTRFSVSTHCKVARRLEREGLNEAALFHAREANLLAKMNRLDDSDPRRLDAISLVAKLEARLRD